MEETETARVKKAEKARRKRLRQKQNKAEWDPFWAKLAAERVCNVNDVQDWIWSRGTSGLQIFPDR